MISPLDQAEGEQYIEPVNDDVQSGKKNLYNITSRREDYVNPTTNGELSWRSIYSYDTNSKDALDR